MDRRAFLKTAAAVPAAGAAASLIGAAPIAEAALAPVAYPYRWWYSHFGDIYTEEFDTRDQALAYLKDVGEGMISECQQQDFHLSLDGDQILEVLQGQNEDLIGEGEFIDPKPEEVSDLGEMVSAAVEAWARKHKICLLAWSFRHTRNTVTAESEQTQGGLF